MTDAELRWATLGANDESRPPWVDASICKIP